MNVTPEIVRAEMDYRVERARHSAELGHLRRAGRTHRGWFRRTRDHHGDSRPTTVNGAPLAA